MKNHVLHISYAFRRYVLMALMLLSVTFSAFADLSYSVTGGVVSGTNQWSTTPPQSCIFTPNGTNEWILDFTFDSSKNSFKLLKKEGGTAGTDWGWSSEFSVTNGANISGGTGDLSITGLSNGDNARFVLTLNGSAYTLSVVKRGFNITASVNNPVTKGAEVVLTANGAESACTWEYSVDGGNTWTLSSDPTSGTLGENLTIHPVEEIKYKATSGSETATYDVIIDEMKYAVSGGVVSGTAQWNTTPSSDCIFVEDGPGRWTLDFIYDPKEFKIISKNGGVADENWGWGGQISNIDNGANVSGNNGNNMSVTGFNAGDAVKLVLTKKEDGRFLLSAEAGHVFKIVSNKANPIVQGDELVLTADGAEGACAWEYSYDGVNWLPFTGSTSGLLNEKISPTPIVATYYRSTDGVSTATYRVTVIINCSGKSQVHLSENFGTLSSAAARKRDNHVPSTYVYSAEGKEVHDGFYSVVANPRGCGRGNRTTPGDCHAESCIGNVNGSGDYWYVDRTDHTGDANGGMLLLNCNNKGEVMYKYTQTGLCKNIYMTFSAWFASASEGIPIKARFMVLDKNGDEIVSARFDVDAISTSDGWKQGQTAFFSGDNETLTVQIVNNGASGNGNDILVDDISFTSCIPKLEIKPGIDVLCGDNSVLSVESEGIEQIFGIAPYYLWQKFDENAADPDDAWVDIPDDPVEGRASMGGSGFDKVKYDYKTQYQAVKPKFRVIMSADPEVAKQVGHNIFPVCNVYAETEIAIVDCGCAPQTIEHKSGDEEQSLCSGDAVDTVVYEASGEKTTSIGVKGFPSSMTASINGTKMTISGKAPVVAEESDLVAKIFAIGVDKVACPSDTLELNLKVFPTPGAPNLRY